LKYLLNAQGTLGDVRPIIALGVAMRNAGHDIIIGAPPNNSDLVLRYKLPFRPIGIDMQILMEEQMKTIQADPLKRIKEFLNIGPTIFSKQFDDLLQAASDCNYIIGSGVDFTGSSVGEYYNIPWRWVTHMPLNFQSKYHPTVLIKNQNLPYWLNQLLWLMHNSLNNGIITGIINKSRRKVGMENIKNIFRKLVQHSIVAADSLLVPMPSDIKDSYTQTGYFFLNDTDELEKDLEQFIKDGPPPVYLGFGSMTDPNPSKTAAIVLELIQSNEHRFVISKGWAKLTSVEKLRNAYFIEHVSHAKLFPKMAAIIHHGGAGTTHTAARAGIPQIIVPHILDQYYWANRVFKLNIGTKPICRSNLASHKLLASINEVLVNKGLQDNAKIFSEHLKEKNGINEVINILTDDKLK
jgi:UDP:flavonoid glycosyltransferase YjiC (YdhE family)